MARLRPLAGLELRPARAFIPSGGSLTYTAWLATADGSRQNVTGQTTFSIRFSAAKTSHRIRPDGSCTGATCTATKLGRHTVTGTLDLEDRTVSGTAALQVVPRHRRMGRPGPLARLTLSPAEAKIEAGQQQSYQAEGYDAAGYDLGDYTAATVFRIDSPGSCTQNSCTATKAKDYTVTGTVIGTDVTGRAVLHVVPGPLARLELSPQTATIRLGDSQAYSAQGFDPYDNSLGDATTKTVFSIHPDGSCTHTSCTATKTGDHRVTGSVDLRTRKVAGTAILHVLTASRGPDNGTNGNGNNGSTNGGTGTRTGCVSAATDVRSFEVAPSKATTGAQVQITAQITRRFGACPVRVFLGGSQFGGDATVGPDGNLSVRRTVPNDAKPGITTVRLATTSGRTLATASFEVLPRTEAAVATPAGRGLPWLLLVLLLLALAVPTLLRERARRQRRWVRHHFRAEPHPSADDLTNLDQDPESAPSLSLRLQAHGDAGTQTLKEGD